MTERERMEQEFMTLIQEHPELTSYAIELIQWMLNNREPQE